MKPFFLASSLLALALVFCLWNSEAVSEKTRRLETLVSSAEIRAGNGDWAGAGGDVSSAYDYWLGQQTYFHIVMEHDALDSAESLFCRLLATGDAQDEAEFCADASELASQLRLLRELEEISIKNIL